MFQCWEKHRAKAQALCLGCWCFVEWHCWGVFIVQSQSETWYLLYYLYSMKVLNLFPVREPSRSAYVRVMHWRGLCQHCVSFGWTFSPPPSHLSVSPSSKDQAEMDPADMEDVEEVEEEETGEDENSKGCYLHSFFDRWTQSIGTVKSLDYCDCRQVFGFFCSSENIWTLFQSAAWENALPAASCGRNFPLRSWI